MRVKLRRLPLTPLLRCSRLALYDRQPLMLLWLSGSFLMLFLSLPTTSFSADLMDQYLSLPGSYVFVRREPEGATSSKVLLTIFEDFLCPACYHTVTTIIPKIQEKYRERIEIRFLAYPLVHEESRLAARAHAIAQEMGLGEQMQKALFHARFEEQLDTTSKGGLAKVAHSIDLDPDVLLSRLDKGDGNAEVDKNLALGESYRIDAVPGVIFDGWIMAKELTQENLEQIIDGLLERKTGAAKKGRKEGLPQKR